MTSLIPEKGQKGRPLRFLKNTVFDVFDRFDGLLVNVQTLATKLMPY
jgi:hypothetical protein